MLTTILIIILLLAVIGAFPGWNYSANWGYGPMGIIAAIAIIWFLLALLGKAPGL